MHTCTLCNKNFSTLEFLNFHYVAMHKTISLPKTCGICYVNKPNALIYPCGHATFCLKCANKLKNKCPMCRNPILDIVQIFD